MNEVLLDAFRHSCWATEHLIDFCRALTPGQLSARAPGAYGAIIETLNHLVLSDGGYLPALTGGGPPWARTDEETIDLDVLAARAREVLTHWERFLAQPLDAERWVALDQGTYEARASVIVAQALHHATLHREQVCAILTGLGLEPPDLQAWAYGEASGRGRPREH